MTTTDAAAASALLELMQNRLIAAAIYAAASLGVADLLSDGPKRVEELASRTSFVVTGGCERAAGFEPTRVIATPAPTGTAVIEGRPLS